MLYAKILQMLATEPEFDPAWLAAVVAPTLVLEGDRDEVALDHGRPSRRHCCHTVRDGDAGFSPPARRA